MSRKGTGLYKSGKSAGFSVKSTRSLNRAMSARIKTSIFGNKSEYVRALIRRDLAQGKSSADLTEYHIPDMTKQRAFDQLLAEKFCKGE